MKNASQKVFWFVLVSFIIYLLVSFLSVFYNHSLGRFDNVNIIADLFPTAALKNKPEIVQDPKAAIIVEKKEHYDFNLFQVAKTITEFKTDSEIPSLQRFMAKLLDQKSGKKKRKIRIAFFGDSMIEGDLMTQTIRSLLQSEFGGSGVGFVPVDCISASNRMTARSSASGWNDHDFKNPDKSIYISGHVFNSEHGSVTISNNDCKYQEPLEKSLICGYADHELNVIYNGQSKKILPSQKLNRISLANDNTQRATVEVNDAAMPVYGISFESENGIIVDNYSYRGITGIELNKVDPSLLKSLSENNHYDLIVFQYGVNLLYRPNDINFNFYANAFRPVIKKFQTAFPEADFLLVSTADRAFRYNGEYKSAIGIDSLVKIQAKLAYESNAAFYNQFKSMGGYNSIVDWATRTPSLANRDYVHPNHRGAEVLANYLYEAIMLEYRKYIKYSNKPQNKPQ